MAISPLQLSGTNVNASTLPHAAQLIPTGGSPTTTAQSTFVGTGTGYGELVPLGSTLAWPGQYALDDATGRGFLWDVTTLEGQQMVAGTWAPSLALFCTGSGGSPSVTLDLYLRAFVYNGGSGAFVAIGAPMLIPALTLTTAVQPSPVVTFALPAAFFGTGDKLYLDVWADITTNNLGSSTLGSISITQLATTTSAGGSSATSVSTPGYQAQTPAQLSTAYSYGGFQLHDLVSYYVTQKTFAMPAVKESLYKIARWPGQKSSGSTVDALTIPLRVRVLGTSRADLEGKWDALLLALSQPQQALILHSMDTRAWLCDCISGALALPPGAVISAEADLQFLAQQPYALGPSRSYVYGPAALALISGATYQVGQQTITGRGTTAALPTITVANNTVTNNSTLSVGLTNGTPYTVLHLATGLPVATAVGNAFILNDGAGHTQTVVAAVAASAGATALTVSSFTANFSYPATTTSVDLDTYVSGVTIAQQADGQTLIISPTPTGFVAGASLVITCDPAAVNGWTVLLNGTGSPQAFTGVFPVQEAYATNWTVQATCNNVPTLTVTWTWQPRFLA